MIRVPTPGSIHAEPHGVAQAHCGATTIGPRPVISSSAVDIHGPAFAAVVREAACWRASEEYANRGPIQFSGVGADDITVTLGLTRGGYMQRIVRLRAALDSIREACRPGVHEKVLDAAETSVAGLVHILAGMQDSSV
jgi:hypothetical protein